ncbi:MAG: hypothetical protein IT306_25095 [Chloroflexi bacterium]|nr:hypothetical protein [Chloroflexota bacterium]
MTDWLAAEPAHQVSWIIEIGLAIVETVVLWPLTLIITALLYLDLRARGGP